MFHALLEDVQIYKLNGLSDSSEYSWQGRLPLSDPADRVDKTVAKSAGCRSMACGWVKDMGTPKPTCLEVLGGGFNFFYFHPTCGRFAF